MRYAPKRGFLYPVLGQRDIDYMNKKFKVNLNCVLVKENYEIAFSANFSTDVEAINECIDLGDAVCIIWVYCGQTSFREIYRTNNNNLRTLRGSIKLQKLRGGIQFHPSIIASKDIYLPLDEANETFRSNGQNMKLIRTGSPLAVHKPFSTELKFDADRGTKSIFQLEVDPNMQEGAWEIEADPRKIFVLLTANKSTRENFEVFRRKGQAMQTLYLSAMVEALNVLLQYFDSDVVDIGADSFSKWTDVVVKKLSSLGIYIKSDENESIKSFANRDERYLTPLLVAQKLLENPLEKVSFEDNNNEEFGD